MRIDEFAKKSEEESNKETKDYRKFIYYELDTLPEERGITTSKINELQKGQTKSQSQTMQPKLDQEGINLEGTKLLPKQT